MAFRNRTPKFIELRNSFHSHEDELPSGGVKPSLRTKEGRVEMKRLVRKGPRALLGSHTEDKQSLLSQAAGAGAGSSAISGSNSGSNNNYGYVASDIESGAVGGAFLNESDVPNWVREVDVIRDHLHKIDQLREELNKMHTEHLRNHFDEDDADADLIQRKSRQIQELFRFCEKGIQNINEGKGGDKQESMMRTNVQRALAVQMSNLSSSFKRDQMNYLRRLKGQEMKTQFAVTEDDTSTFDEELRNSSQGFLLGAEIDVNKRAKEIEGISESITELASMFKEMAALVIDQGTIIDRIDYNVEMVHGHTRKAREELEKTHKQMASKRLFGCKLCLIVSICIMALILVIKLINKVS